MTRIGLGTRQRKLDHLGVGRKRSRDVFFVLFVIRRRGFPRSGFGRDSFLTFERQFSGSGFARNLRLVPRRFFFRSGFRGCGLSLDGFRVRTRDIDAHCLGLHLELGVDIFRCGLFLVFYC